MGSFLCPERVAIKQLHGAIRSATPGMPTGCCLAPASLAITPTVGGLVPALNEAVNLPYVFRSLPSRINKIVLVDDGSADDTVHVAKRLCPDVKVIMQIGWEVGRALIEGLAASSGAVIVSFDAGSSIGDREIIRFGNALLAAVSFAKSSRSASGAGTQARHWSNYFLSDLVDCYGYNTFRRYHTPVFQLKRYGFAIETAMNIYVAIAGLRGREAPGDERPRLYRLSDLSVARNGCRIINEIAFERLDRSLRDSRGRRPQVMQSPSPDSIQPNDLALISVSADID